MRSFATPAPRRALGGRRPTVQRTNEVVTRPAPVGGWNARDSLALMDPTDAVVLDNFFPAEGKVELRRGFLSHGTGVGSGAVETVVEYHAGATRRLIAAGGGGIYNATTPGAATALATGFSGNRWQGVNMNGLLGLVNGADAPQEYNGTTVGAMTVSGPTVANLIGINVFKSRSYFFEKNSQDFWYSAVNALGGALTQFPLSRVGSFGGNLIAMGTWTLDSGAGVDDLAVFIMSSGEVIIYAGSNPGDASDWALVGVFKIGAPLDVRGVAKFGGDLIVMTKDGYAPLGKVLKLGQVNVAGAISDKIRGAVIAVAKTFEANAGWQVVLYPRGNRMIFNVPISTTTFHQHVVNTVTGAWTRFTGMNARCWGLYADELYFGGAGGIVYRADLGYNDGGGDIMADAVTAFDYLGNTRENKVAVAINPMLSAAGLITFGAGVHADFSYDTIPNDPYSFAGSLGGEDYWESITTNFEDTEIVFGSPIGTINRKWVKAKGKGIALAAHLSLAGQTQVDWYATRYMLERGGVT